MKPVSAAMMLLFCAESVLTFGGVGAPTSAKVIATIKAAKTAKAASPTKGQLGKVVAVFRPTTAATPRNTVVLESGLPNGVAALVPIDPSGFCTDKISESVFAANGTQLKVSGQSCSSNTLGSTPSVDNMVSTLIVSPESGADLDASIENKVVLDTSNLVSGFFSDANLQYYLAPQSLAFGFVQGHQHITMQQLDGKNVLPAKKFDFFKGINDAAVDPNKRSLEATIAPGTLLANGAFRICSITGSDTHQPIISPVQRRGPQDDCIRVNVINAGLVAPPAAAAAAVAAVAAGSESQAVGKNGNNGRKGAKRAKNVKKHRGL